MSRVVSSKTLNEYLTRPCRVDLRTYSRVSSLSVPSVKSTLSPVRALTLTEKESEVLFNINSLTVIFLNFMFLRLLTKITK